MPPDIEKLLTIIEQKKAIADQVYNRLCEIASILCSGETSEDERPVEPTELW